MVVESHCQTRKYQDKNGEDRIATEFIVDKAHFCGPKQSNRQEPVDDGGTNPPPSTYRNQQPQQMGRESMQMALKAIRKEPIDSYLTIVPTEMFLSSDPEKVKAWLEARPDGIP